MKRSLVTGHLFLLSLTSAALVLTTTLTVLHGQPARKAAPSADRARQVADDLDAVIQPRFQDDRAGVFGVSRVITPEQLASVGGHWGLALLQPKTVREAALLRHAQAQGRDYMVGFLHCAHVPGQLEPGGAHAAASSPDVKPYLRLLLTDPSQMYTRILRPAPAQQITQQVAPVAQVIVPRTHQGAVPLFGPNRFGGSDREAIQRCAIAALSLLRAGEGQEATVGNWLVVMQPVRAMHDSCLGCHTGAKHGDTLGAMVYAVSRTAHKSGA